MHITSTKRPSKMHIIHFADVMPDARARRVRYVRLRIHRPATRFGSSIWRLQVWGTPVIAPVPLH